MSWIMAKTGDNISIFKLFYLFFEVLKLFELQLSVLKVGYKLGSWFLLLLLKCNDSAFISGTRKVLDVIKILKEIFQHLARPIVFYNVGSTCSLIPFNCWLHKRYQVSFEVLNALSRKVLIVGQLVKLFVYLPNDPYGLFFKLSVQEIFYFIFQLLSFFFELFILLSSDILMPSFEPKQIKIFMFDSP